MRSETAHVTSLLTSHISETIPGDGCQQMSPNSYLDKQWASASSLYSSTRAVAQRQRDTLHEKSSQITVITRARNWPNWPRAGALPIIFRTSGVSSEAKQTRT